MHGDADTVSDTGLVGDRGNGLAVHPDACVASDGRVCRDGGVGRGSDLEEFQ